MDGGGISWCRYGYTIWLDQSYMYIRWMDVRTDGNPSVFLVCGKPKKRLEEGEIKSKNSIRVSSYIIYIHGIDDPAKLLGKEVGAPIA